MKHGSFRLYQLLMALTKLASMSEAKKIRFGTYITYGGKKAHTLCM